MSVTTDRQEANGIGSPPPVKGTRRRRSVMASPVARHLGLVAALVVLCVIGLVTAGDRFGTESNIRTVLTLSVVIGVLSVGMTFVIIGGGIDLSVGSLVALASVWSTTQATQSMSGSSWWLIAVTSMLVGTVCGVVNGVFVAFGPIVPFIMTLATMAAAKGLAEVISAKKTQVIKDPAFKDFFNSSVLGVPVQVLVFLVVAVIGWIVLNRTTFGRRTYAVGGNPEAARLAGLGVRTHTVALYALMGLCCGIAAIIISARTNSGSSNLGSGYELDAIAAVVIGGTLLTGGRGTIMGTVLGVLIFTTLNNVFTLNNLDTSTQQVAKGAIIVVAVLLQQRLARSQLRA
ncbi:monosaccharide ABC transporter membrane protein, CUT2 family [Nakamurella panacisegetis]|uniref:Monosaccharide ABC transporter membrane protein, CUT2 family n=1 Tax=Nakamurella panacisegetis TaxID=1090615 RepID=A0A1H0HMP0_9ACTN|nr:ABC transporter permease [Nakamurella panacisegetis]SDO20445.1 monosaccharide ABC transporter membrane protein, CUT2 family [Nakamurella panacisegetis]